MTPNQVSSVLWILAAVLLYAGARMAARELIKIVSEFFRR